LHNQKLKNLYFFLNVIQMIKLRLRCVRHIAHTGEMKNAYESLDFKGIRFDIFMTMKIHIVI
jgi:hypothetical protein